MHLEVAKVIKAPRERVFSAYADIESMPKWSRSLSAARVISREGGMITYEGEASSRGGTRKFAGTLRVVPPERAETESETRFVETKAVVSFAVVPEGTKVTTTLDVNAKGIWAKLLSTQSRADLDSRARENLELFAKYVEGLP